MFPLCPSKNVLSRRAEVKRHIRGFVLHLRGLICAPTGVDNTDTHCSFINLLKDPTVDWKIIFIHELWWCILHFFFLTAKVVTHLVLWIRINWSSAFWSFFLRHKNNLKREKKIYYPQEPICWCLEAICGFSVIDIWWYKMEYDEIHFCVWDIVLRI